MKLQTHHKNYLVAAAHGSITGILGAVIATVIFIHSPFMTPSAFADTCVAPPGNLNHSWGFESNSLDGKGTADGVLAGGASFTTGKVGQALNLTNASQYVDLSSRASEFNQNGPWSLEGWVNLNGDTCRTLFQINDGTTNNVAGIFLGDGCTNTVPHSFIHLGRVSGGSLTYALEYTTSTRSELIDSGWHHVAVTYGGTGGTTKVYVDGSNKPVTAAVGTNAGIFANLPNITRAFLGGSAIGGSSFNGALDEVHIYDKELTAAEVSSIVTSGSAELCKTDSDHDSVADNLDFCAASAGTVNAAGCSATSPTPAPANLTHLFDGDHVSGTTTTDAVNPAITGTLVNGAATVAGKVGNAFSFNGVNSYMDIAHDNSFDIGTGNFSLGAWIKTGVTTNSSGGGSFSTIQSMITQRNPANGGQGYTWFLRSGQLSFIMNDGTATEFNSGITLSDGQWHHVFLTVNRTSTFGGLMYVDGQPVYSFNPTVRPGSLSFNSPVRVGNDTWNTQQAFQGQIDEAQWYSRALSAKEVFAAFSADSQGIAPTATCGDGTINQATEECDDGNTTGGDGCSATCKVDQCVAPKSGLTLWYKLDETSGNTLIDSIAGNNGIHFGASTTGKIDGGDQFNGTDYVQLPNTSVSDMTGTTDFTVEGWIKKTSPGGGTFHVMGARPGCSAGSNFAQMYIADAQGWGFNIAGGGFATGPAYYPVQNQWYHVALTNQSGFGKMYLNGVLVASGSLGTQNSGQPLRLGTSGSCVGLSGIYDDFQFYNRALSQNEINMEYNSQSAGTCALTCGDGLVTGTEQCDDGNSVNGDGCTSMCTAEVCTDSNPDISHKWKAENNGNDVRTTAPLVTDAGTISYVAGKVGQAFSFNGSTRLGTGSPVSSPAALVGNVPYSFTGWIKTTTGGWILSQRSTSGFSGEYYIYVNPEGTLGFAAYAGNGDASGFGANFSSNSTVLTDGQWHQFAITKGTAIPVSMYIDGVLDKTSGTKNIAFSNLGVYLGGNQRENNGFFTGQMDEITIWNRQLTAGEVESLYLSQGLGANSCGVNTCGDGARYGNEECDDGNTADGDGCSSLCVVETCTSLPVGGVASYKAENNANDSVGTNNGTLQSGVTASSTGRIGNAFTFTGAANQRVLIPDSATFAFTNGVSIDAWVNLATTGARTVAGKYNTNNGGASWAFTTDASNRLVLSVYNNAGQDRTFTTTQALVTNTWTHVAATYDLATAVGAIYINGVSVPVTASGQSTLAQIRVTTTPVTIGAITNISNVVSQIWNGQIDEINFYNKAISASDMQRIYNSGSAGICALSCGNNVQEGTEQCDDGNNTNGDGCSATCTAEICAGNASGKVLYLKAENNGNDSSTSGYNAQVLNGATYAAGRQGQGFVLDGSNDVIQVPTATNINFGDTAHSFSLWFKSTTASTSFLMSKHFGGSANGFFMEINPTTGNGYPATVAGGIGMYFAGTTYVLNASGLNDGQWHQVGWTFEPVANTLKVYVDGSVDRTITTANGLVSTGDLDFGGLTQNTATPCSNAAPCRPYAGMLDEIQFFSRTVTDSEMIQLYNSGAANLCTTTAVCGDNLKEYGEGCDDGNTADGDGCSATCTVEVCNDGYASKVFHFGLNETATSGTVTDSAHNLTGSYSGVTSVAGHNGTAMQTIASNTSGINLGDRPQFTTTTQVTLSAWVKQSAYSANTNIINKDQCNVSIAPYGLGFDATGKPGFFVQQATNGLLVPGTSVGAISPSLMSLGEWHQVTGTYNGSVAKLYIDGVEVASTNGTITMFDSPGALTIGSRIGCSGEFNQQPGGTTIDDVEMYTTGLTAAQVASTYNSSNGGVCNNTATCGDNHLQATEQCDDGNTADGDGCSATCTNEICSDATQELTAIYHGENNTTDSSGNGNTATANNGATYAVGKVGQAFSLDGIDDFISAAHSSTLSFPGSLSFSAWIRPTSLANNPVILSKEVSTGNRFGLQANSNGSLCFYLNAASCLVTTNAGLITTNTWNHVAVVLNTTGDTAGIYVNGALATFVSTTSDASSNTGALAIGKSGTLAGLNFTGLIDEVSLFNRNLSAAEVAQLYNADQFGQCVATVGICGNGTVEGTEQCDDGNTANGDGCDSTCHISIQVCDANMSNEVLDLNAAKQTAEDVSGTGNDGTFNGSMTTVSDTDRGYAYSFNGTSQYISIPTSATLDSTGSFTYSVWVKPTDVDRAEPQRLFSKFGSSTNQKWLWIEQGGKIGMGFNGSDTATITPTNAGFVTSGTWTQVTVSYNASNGQTKFYKNGVLMETKTAAIGIQSNSAAFEIGRSGQGNQYYNGLMDDMRMFSRVLSGSEVASLYNTPTTGMCSASAAVCGNDILEVGEACDDGNTANGDSCSSTCTLEICADTNPARTHLYKAEGNANDTVGSSNGTVNGSVSYTDGQADSQAFDFTNGSIDFGTGPSFSGTGAHAMSFWVKTTSTTLGTLMSQRDTNGFSGAFDMQLSPEGFVKYYEYDGTVRHFITSTVAINDGVWHLVTLVRDTGNVKLYIDGTLDQNNNDTNVSLNSAIHASIGKNIRDNLDPLVGQMDQVAYWNRALTASEVMSLFVKDEAGVCSENIPDPVVGNGIVEPGEQCDDGNTANGDGCSSTGQFESQGFCPTPGTYTGDQTIDHNCTLVPGTYIFENNLTIAPASGSITVTMKSNPAATGYKGVDLQVHGNLTVASGAHISADGQGTVAQQFPALNPCGTTDSNDYQSSYETGFGGVNCGDPKQPETLGGAGDKGIVTTAGYSNGGGAMKIDVDGVFTQNGTISSDGLGNRTKLFDYTPNGGGAGGSIWIIASTFAGSGAIHANGGPNAQMSTYTNIGRGGHGGHVAIEATASAYTGQIKTEGSALGMNMGIGDNGSIILNNQAFNSGTSFTPLSAGCPLPGSYTGDLTIDHTCTLLAGTYNVDGNVTIGGITPITVTAQTLPQLSNPSYAGVHFVVTGNMTIASNATLSADAQGFGSKMGGLGNGVDSQNGAGGAGYCGLGGHGTTVAGGVSYGDANFPLEPGSSGGDNAWARGGKGGGALWLTVSSELAINGTISANGASGNAGLGGAAGGGSGGALNLTADVISGNGLVRANGGNGTGIVQHQGGGGSAGRIHLGTNTNNFTGTKQTNGGGAVTAVSAQVGSSCTVAETTFVQTCGNGTLETGELCDDNNTNTTDACTSLCLSANFTVSGNAAIADAQRGTTDNYVGYTVNSTATNSFGGTLTATSNRPFLKDLHIFKDTDTNCSNGGLTAVTGTVTIAPGDNHFCIQYDVDQSVSKVPQPKLTLALDLVTGHVSPSISSDNIEIDVFPKRDTFDGTTTNFEAYTNLRSVNTPTVEKQGFGKVSWLGALNVAYEDFDANMRLGARFVSFNPSAADASLLSTPATVTFEDVTCDNFSLYYATGFRTSAQDIVDFGTRVATQDNNAVNCTDSSICRNIQCLDNTLTFQAQHFDGFAVGTPSPGTTTGSSTGSTGSTGGSTVGAGTTGGGGGASSGSGAGGTTGGGAGGTTGGGAGGSTGSTGVGSTGGSYISVLNPLWGNIVGAPGYLWGSIIGGAGGGTGGGAGGGTGGGAGGGTAGGGGASTGGAGGSIGGGGGGASGGGAGGSTAGGGGGGSGGSGGSIGGGGGTGGTGGSGYAGGLTGIGGFIGAGGTGGGTGGTGGTTGILQPIVWTGLTNLTGSSSTGSSTSILAGGTIVTPPTTGGTTGTSYNPLYPVGSTSTTGYTTGSTGEALGFSYGTTGNLTTGSILGGIITETTGGNTGTPIIIGNSNINGTILNPIQNENTNTTIIAQVNNNVNGGGSDIEETRSSAPGTSSGSTIEGGMCIPPQLRDFVSSDTLQQLATMCQDPMVLQQIVGISPRITYNQKFEEYTFRGLINNELPANINTIGIRDSDTDGLSDAQELELGTDPFYWDTDHDGYTDGEEVLTYGTNPLDPKSRTDGRSILITNIKDGMVTTDTHPVIAGIATPASLVEVRDGSGSGTVLLGTTRTDAKGKFLLVPQMEMAAGDHTVQASEVTEAGNVITTSPRRQFTIAPTLAIAPPQITRIETKADCHTYVYGRSQVGTSVVGYFQSLLTVSSIVADSASGEFVVKSSSCLEPGQHTATLYATIPTGERSAAVQQKFTVVPAGQGSPWDILPWLVGLAALLILWAGLRKKVDMILFMETPDQWATLKAEYDQHLMEAQKRRMQLMGKADLTPEEEAEVVLQTSMRYRPEVPVQRKDLSMRYIGFATQQWVTDEDGTRHLHAQVEMTGRIIAFELWTPGQKEPLTLLPGQVMPQKLRNVRITYRFVPDPLEEKKLQISAFNGTLYGDHHSYRESEGKQPVSKTVKA